MLTPYLDDGDVRLYHGDCVEVMARMDAESVDAVVCDPPYGLEFMGKEWDAPWKGGGNAGAVVRDPATERGGFQDGNGGNPYSRSRIAYGRGNRGESAAFQSWCETWAREALRVLKPGGHLLAFGGTRTYHRLTCAIEDAGFEIRDCLSWLYGSGFPKSLDVSKAIDKAKGAEREVVETIPDRWAGKGNVLQRATQAERNEAAITAPATPDAVRWQGWGTALKPAWEPVVVARKPLAGTVAGNVLAYGTGALNISACRIGPGHANGIGREGEPSADLRYTERGGTNIAALPGPRGGDPSGRWPANVALDGEAAALLDTQSGERGGGPLGSTRGSGPIDGRNAYAMSGNGEAVGYGDTGGASRFFYTAKASRADRGDGNTHPTVKPTDLMRWLIRLVTPPGGLILDPFAGSGTTGVAARAEGVRCVLIEREDEYLPIIAGRLSQLSLLGDAC